MLGLTEISRQFYAKSGKCITNKKLDRQYNGHSHPKMGSKFTCVRNIIRAYNA